MAPLSDEPVTMAHSPLRILVTGASGNLGRKLIPFLLTKPWCRSIVGVDRSFGSDLLPNEARLDKLIADLTVPTAALHEAVSSVDAVVHLAAQNPHTDASWADSTASFDMTVNLVECAREGGKRFVFASSNHVMGGYKDTPLALEPGSLKTDLPPMPGTRFEREGRQSVSTPYATAKLMGERLCMGVAAASGLSAVALRIGWCQPDTNHPRTITGSGTTKEGDDAEDAQAMRDLRWFRNMWLSNRDFLGITGAAIVADAGQWPTRGIVLNAVSGNTGTPWDLTPSRKFLGYSCSDDVWRVLDL